MTLQEILNLRNMTQKTLAIKLKVTQPIVSFWCNSKRTPTFANMQKLAEVLEVDFQTIVKCFTKDNKEEE